ncbi:MAG: tetratricopeptide repeat protein [candidate division Zixibacteria bacterium]|nr:tetratricopeptide repeat protein [candidate division Zixibacteria bacterium]
MSRAAQQATAIVIIAILFFLAVACGPKTGDQMPITTKSEEALETFNKGRSLAERLRGYEAREYFQEAVDLDSNFALAHIYLAFTQPTNREVVASLEQAVALKDKVSEGERIWIEALQAGMNGDNAGQETLLVKLSDMYPNDPWARSQLGNFRFGQQRYDDAIAIYQDVIQKNPDFTQPYNMLGYCYRYMSDYTEAEKYFQEYAKLIPKDPNPYDSYADLLTEMGQYTESIELYRKALANNSRFMPSHLGIAHNLNLLDKHDEARDYLQGVYRKALNNQQRRDLLYATAISWADEGYLDAALEVMQERLVLVAQDNDTAVMSQTLATMGIINVEAGAADAAEQKYHEAVELVLNSGLSDDVKNNARRSQYYYDCRVALVRNDVDSAAKLVDEYQRLALITNNPNTIRLVHQVRGMIALQRNEFALAAAELEKSDLQSSYNLYRLGIAYRESGDVERAREMFVEASKARMVNSLSYAFCRKQVTAALAALDQQL